MMEVTYTTPGVTNLFKTISETMRQPNLMVNIDGKRFIDESIMNNTTFTGNAISVQPQRKAFTIITDSILDEYRAQGHLDYITIHHNIQNVDHWEEQVKAYFSEIPASPTRACPSWRKIPTRSPTSSLLPTALKNFVPRPA